MRHPNLQKCIDWFNSIPIAKTKNDIGRRICSACGMPIYAATTNNSEIFVKCDHRKDCDLWNNYEKKTMWNWIKSIFLK